jgi:hypothetical protein
MSLRRKSIAVAAMVMLFSGAWRTSACTLAWGYFYQVTNLKGKVVGTNIFLLPRWLRQLIGRRQLKMRLYDYCLPCAVKDQVAVKSVLTDDDGRFDFGSLKPGHYRLMVDGEEWINAGTFDVEVKGSPNPKESVLIDVSPIAPDCTGGHEFIVSAK